MNGLKEFKKVKIGKEEVTICDLSVEYVSRMQTEDGFDNMENALEDACEFSYSRKEVGYKAGLVLYKEIINHTFGEIKSEGEGDAKK